MSKLIAVRFTYGEGVCAPSTLLRSDVVVSDTFWWRRRMISRRNIRAFTMKRVLWPFTVRFGNSRRGWRRTRRFYVDHIHFHSTWQFHVYWCLWWCIMTDRAWPTSSWNPGELIASWHIFKIPLRRRSSPLRKSSDRDRQKPSDNGRITPLTMWSCHPPLFRGPPIPHSPGENYAKKLSSS